MKKCAQIKDKYFTNEDRTKAMLEFQSVKKRDAARLRRYYEHCEYGLCEYSVGTKLMWRGVLHPSWTEAAGCLVVRNEIGGQVVFD